MEWAPHYCSCRWEFRVLTRPSLIPPWLGSEGVPHHCFLHGLIDIAEWKVASWILGSEESPGCLPYLHHHLPIGKKVGGVHYHWRVRSNFWLPYGLYWHLGWVGPFNARQDESPGFLLATSVTIPSRGRNCCPLLQHCEDGCLGFLLGIYRWGWGVATFFAVMFNRRRVVIVYKVFCLARFLLSLCFCKRKKTFAMTFSISKRWQFWVADF